MDADAAAAAAATASPDRMGDKLIRRCTSTEQPLSPKDERIVSANPSPDAATVGPLRDFMGQSESSDTGRNLTIMPPVDAYATYEQPPTYDSYANNTGVWNGYSQYVNPADGLHLSPVLYNDNPSLVFHSGYGFNPEMAYGQYSPVATPLPSMMLESQLYSPQHIPFSPSFYPQTGPSNVPSSVPLSWNDFMTSESNGDSLLFGPGSGYLVQFGSYGGGNMSGTPVSSPLASPAPYSQPMGILGPYEHHVGQVPQQSPLHGYGLTTYPSFGRHQHGGSYQTSGFGSVSTYPGANDRLRLPHDKGRRRERDQDSIYTVNDSLDFDRNRGPRASKPKGKSSTEQSSSGHNKENSCGTGAQLDLYNQPDFVTDYKKGKFFIIKSFSEDNVHKSIKYGVWASTAHGNKKLDVAYQEAKEIGGTCPVFLFFSVNASGQFCGVAEMVGPVDFEKDADYWQQDRWSGQFPVQWHIIKDVPNGRFRHILLENNDNKPVTHSRDAQEVKLEQGIEMLKIFKDHEAHTSIIDDFDFYDQREISLKERRAKQQTNSAVDAQGLLAGETINQISDNLTQALQLGEDGNETAAAGGKGASSITDSVVSATNDVVSSLGFQLANHSITVVSPTEDSVKRS